MKLLNATIALGTLAHVSQGIAIQTFISNEELSSLDSNLVNRASDGTTSRVENVMNGAVELAKRAQDVGLTNWWGWYAIAIVDATADLVTDVVSDAYDWGTEAADGFKPYVEDLAGDID